MFWTRLLSGIVLVILALLTINAGGIVCLCTMFAVSLVGLRELLKAFSVIKAEEKKGLRVIELIAYLACAVYYGLIYFCQLKYLGLFVVVFLIALLFMLVVTYPKYKAEELAKTFFSFIYVVLPISFIYLTADTLEHGKYLVWLIFLCSWGADTCAYVVGMTTAKTVGNHKMAPVLSPKKSIEGAIGGIVGAFLLGFAYASIMNKVGDLNHEAIYYGILCAVGAFVSMFGDLAASAIKREYGIKDYGKLIPGHGGIMDRFDSVIITAPIIYYLSILLIG